MLLAFELSQYYTVFALKPVGKFSGREPTFLLAEEQKCVAAGPARCSGTSRMDLERIREAAERVARSEGLDVVEVEWKVGKQRFLRITIDRPQAPASSAGAEAAGAAPEQLGGGAPRGGTSGGNNHPGFEGGRQQVRGSRGRGGTERRAPDKP